MMLDIILDFFFFILQNPTFSQKGSFKLIKSRICLPRPRRWKILLVVRFLFTLSNSLIKNVECSRYLRPLLTFLDFPVIKYENTACRMTPCGHTPIKILSTDGFLTLVPILHAVLGRTLAEEINQTPLASWILFPAAGFLSPVFSRPNVKGCDLVVTLHTCWGESRFARHGVRKTTGHRGCRGR